MCPCTLCGGSWRWRCHSFHCCNILWLLFVLFQPRHYFMANPEQRNERKESIRLHRHHHRRRRWRRRRRRLSFDTVVIHWVFVRSCFFSHWLMLPNVCVRIEIWIENCYHKHIWLGLFLYAWTQFAVNSITENIINHFGKFFCFSPISMCSAASYSFFCSFSFSLKFRRLLLNFIAVFFFRQLVNLWCKRFLFIFPSHFCRCDCRIGSRQMNETEREGRARECAWDPNEPK